MSEEAPTRGYVDLCARPSTTDYALSMLRMYARLGYDTVVLEPVPGVDRSALESETSVRVLWRRTVHAKSSREVRRGLRDASRYDIVAVSPSTLEAARYAARSKEVDIIVVEPGMERLIDPGTLELFTQRGWGAVEILLSPLIHALEGPDRRLEAVLRYLFVSMRRAAGYRVPLVVSSCAETEWELFHPFHAAGLATITGVPFEEALSWVSSVPLSVISRKGHPGKPRTPS